MKTSSRWIIGLATLLTASLPLTSIAEVLDQKSCKSCKDGEWASAQNVTIGHGAYTYITSPGCGNPVSSADQIRAILSDASKVNLKDAAGGVFDIINNEARKFISDNIHGEIGQILNGGNPNTAACQTVCTMIPTNATYTGYWVGAKESGSSQFSQCSVGSDCGIGWSKWVSEPSKSSDGNVSLVCSVFQNWSHDRTREARLVAYFKPASNWAGPRVGSGN